jgi:hypothetical protein
MALGLTSLFKKKISEEKVAELFVNISFNAVDTSFAEVAELLNNDVNLITEAQVNRGISISLTITSLKVKRTESKN